MSVLSPSGPYILHTDTHHTINTYKGIFLNHEEHTQRGSLLTALPDVTSLHTFTRSRCLESGLGKDGSEKPLHGSEDYSALAFWAGTVTQCQLTCIASVSLGSIPTQRLRNAPPFSRVRPDGSSGTSQACFLSTFSKNRVTIFAEGI